MPSNLEFRAFEINQAINNHLTFFPLQWSKISKKWIWKLGASRQNLKIYVIVSATWKLLGMAVGIFLLIQILTHRKLFRLEHFFTSMIALLACFLSFVTDCMIVVCGREVVACCNWCYEAENLWMRHCMESSFLLKFLPGVRKGKLLRSAGKDTVAVLVLLFSLSLTIFCALAVFILIVLNWDPLSILSTIFTKIYFPGNKMLIDFTNGYVYTISRFVLQPIIVEWLAVNIRTLIIVSLTLGASFINLESILLQLRVNDSSVGLYKQLIVERNVLIECEKAVVTVFLTLVFFVLAVSVNAVEIGFYRGSPIIAGTSAGIFLLTLSVLMISLNVCCLIYERSIKIVSLWKIQVVHSLSRGYTRRVIKSCKALVVPAGDMGKVDKEMKTNYFAAVLVNSVNLLLTINQFVN